MKVKRKIGQKLNGFSRKPYRLSLQKKLQTSLRLSKSMDDHMSRFCRLIPNKETITISTYRLGNRGVGFLFSVFRVFLSRSYLRTSSTQLNHDIEVLCTLQSACTLVQNGQEEVRCRGRKPQDGLSNKGSDQLSILRGVNTLFEGTRLNCLLHAQWQILHQKRVSRLMIKDTSRVAS